MSRSETRIKHSDLDSAAYFQVFTDRHRFLFDTLKFKGISYCHSVSFWSTSGWVEEQNPARNFDSSSMFNRPLNNWILRANQLYN